jgi:general secretion pathway protein G
MDMLVDTERDERSEDSHDDKGFTLIELLIVIVILGILAAVVVLSVRGITDKGQANACKAQYKALETAVEAFYAETGAMPADEPALVAANLLNEQSEWYDITNGDIDPVANPAKCTYDPVP